jgi:hypothetical protein
LSEIDKKKRTYGNKKKKLGTQELHQIIRDYDTQCLKDFQLYNEYKHTKWGEHEFCRVNAKDLSFTLSVTDNLTSTAFWTIMKHYMKLYLIHSRKFLLFRHEKRCSFIIKPPKFIKLCKKRNTYRNKTQQLLPTSPHCEPSSLETCPLLPSKQCTSCTVKTFSQNKYLMSNVLHLVMDVSLVAKRVFKYFCIPACPKRHRVHNSTVLICSH